MKKNLSIILALVFVFTMVFGSISLAEEVLSWPLVVGTHSTWLHGDIVKGEGDVLPVDSEVTYEGINPWVMELPSDAKGSARFLGLRDIQLAGYEDTAYIEVAVKGNGIAENLDIYFITNPDDNWVDPSQSWGQFTGITENWQVMKFYLKDLVLIGGPERKLDEIWFFDLYAENVAGAKFWIGAINFFSDEPVVVEDPTSQETDPATTPEPTPGDSSVSGLIIIFFILSIGSILTIRIKNRQGDI